MAGHRRVGRRHRAALALISLVLATAGCGGDDAEHAAGGTSRATPSVAATPTSATATATADPRLLGWAGEVCAAADQLSLADLAPDVRALTVDPEGAVRDTLVAAEAAPDRLRSFADRLEALGPPPVADGAALSEGFVAASRSLADALEQGLADARRADDAQAQYLALTRALGSPQLQRQLTELSTLTTRMRADDDLAAALADVPACAALPGPAATPGG